MIYSPTYRTFSTSNFATKQVYQSNSIAHVCLSIRLPRELIRDAERVASRQLLHEEGEKRSLHKLGRRGEEECRLGN